MKNVELNESCTHHSECTANNSICYGSCRCRTSHVINKDGKQCLPYASSLYQMCQEDSQCALVHHSFCGSNNTCVCLPDHHDINSVRISEGSYKDERFLNVQISLNFFQRCHVSVRLGGTCEDDNNCITAHSSCTNRKCKCDEDFHESRGKFCSAAPTVQINFLVLLALSFVRLL